MSLEQASAAFEASLANDPDFVPALVSLADAYMLLGDNSICYGRTPMAEALEQALPLLDKAESLHPDSEEVHTSYAFYFLLLGDVERAQIHAEKAIVINGNCSRAYRTLGLILKRSGNPRALVVRTKEKALHLDPASPIDLINLFEELGVRGRFTESIALLDRLKAASPDSVFLDWGRLSVAWDRGRLNDTLEIYIDSPQLQRDQQWAFAIQHTLTLFGYGRVAEQLNLHSAFKAYCLYGYRDDANRIGALLEENTSSSLHSVSPITLALWHVQEERYQRADELLRPYEERDPLKWGPLYDLDNHCLGARLAWLVKERLGDADKAQQYNDKLREFYAVRCVDHEGIHMATSHIGACIACMQGDIETALEEIKVQTERFSISSYEVFFDPLLIPLNGEPDFQCLKQKTEEEIMAEKYVATTSGILPPPAELFKEQNKI